MDLHALRAVFDHQVRQNTEPDGTGAVTEADAGVVRRVMPAGREGSAIVWSELSESSADMTIASQIAFFARRDQSFEWKLYDYDKPDHLSRRLVSAGLVADEPESLMIGEVARVLAVVPAAVPGGIRLLTVGGPSGARLVTAVHDRVFGARRPGCEEWTTPSGRAAYLTCLTVAMVGDEAVCAGRIEFVPGSHFAGLWGGGTVPAWRGRGIYRALVRFRAAIAARRGYRYLTVDASSQSMPVLLRAGFVRIAGTTPYDWRPSRCLRQR